MKANISQYERDRLERIAYNHQRLVELGFETPITARCVFATLNSTATRSRSRTRVVTTTTTKRNPARATRNSSPLYSVPPDVGLRTPVGPASTMAKRGRPSAKGLQTLRAPLPGHLTWWKGKVQEYSAIRLPANEDTPTATSGETGDQQSGSGEGVAAILERVGLDADDAAAFSDKMEKHKVTLGILRAAVQDEKSTLFEKLWEGAGLADLWGPQFELKALLQKKPTAPSEATTSAFEYYLHCLRI